MKHILSVDVQKKDGGYTFTLHYDKKTTTFKIRSILEGFEKVEQIIMKEWEGEYEW